LRIIAMTNPFGPLSGTIFLLGTIFADRFERKWQIVVASFGMLLLMAVFSTLNATVPLIVVGMLFALVSNIMGYTYHAYMAELFPTRIRARAVGFAYSWSRVSGACAGITIGYLLGGRRCIHWNSDDCSNGGGRASRAVDQAVVA
jgi:putative MFS transporter